MGDGRGEGRREKKIIMGVWVEGGERGGEGRGGGFWVLALVVWL